VKRNIKRLQEDFCFQLTKEETESLKCQSGTSKIPERMDEVAINVKHSYYAGIRKNEAVCS